MKILQKHFSGITTRQVNKDSDNQLVRQFVTGYFRDYRPIFEKQGINDSSLIPIDEEIQNLLRFAQGRSLSKLYNSTIKNISKILDSLEFEGLTTAHKLNKTSKYNIGSQDKLIIETLYSLRPSAGASYEQGVLDLSGKDRKSWRGTAAEFREALREVLHQLAPDEAVKSQPGFKLDKDQKEPRMRQRTVFILKSRNKSKRVIGPTTKAVDVVEEKVGSFVRSVYDQSSASTHGQTSRDDVVSIKNFVDTILCELLEISN